MAERDTLLWAVDGIEEGMARLEAQDGGAAFTLPQSLLPAGTVEGQLLRVTRGPDGAKGSVTLTITFDEAATAAALARSRETTARASAASKARDPGGDVAL